MMPRDFDIAQWQGPTGLAVPFANLPGRGCYEARWSYFAPRFGLAWRLFGDNRIVLRVGAGLTYDQEIGIIRARTMMRARGRIFIIRPRGAETPGPFTGKRLDLPSQTALGEYRTDFMSELDWQEGQVYSYNLSLQARDFPGDQAGGGLRGQPGLLPDRIADGYLGEGERSVDRWFDTRAFVAPTYDSSLCQGADFCHGAAHPTRPCLLG